MKKDYIRDYATGAFRYYAGLGRPSFEQAKEAVFARAVKDAEMEDPQAAVVAGERAVRNSMPQLLDIYAADMTMRLLTMGGRDYIARAVEEVYFTGPKLPLRKGDISARVLRCCRIYHADERTVYRWLRDARRMFAGLRGLRM